MNDCAAACRAHAGCLYFTYGKGGATLLKKMESSSARVAGSGTTDLNVAKLNTIPKGKVMWCNNKAPTFRFTP